MAWVVVFQMPPAESPQGVLNREETRWIDEQETPFVVFISRWFVIIPLLTNIVYV